MPIAAAGDMGSPQVSTVSPRCRSGNPCGSLRPGRANCTSLEAARCRPYRGRRVRCDYGRSRTRPPTIASRWPDSPFHDLLGRAPAHAARALPRGLFRAAAGEQGRPPLRVAPPGSSGLLGDRDRCLSSGAMGKGTARVRGEAARAVVVSVDRRMRRALGRRSALSSRTERRPGREEAIPPCWGRSLARIRNSARPGSLVRPASPASVCPSPRRVRQRTTSKTFFCRPFP